MSKINKKTTFILSENEFAFKELPSEGHKTTKADKQTSITK